MRIRWLAFAVLVLASALSACSAGNEKTLAGGVQVKSSHLPAKLTSSPGDADPPLSLVRLSRTIELGPPGALAHPVTVTIPLIRNVPTDMAVVVATAEPASGPWSYLPAKVSEDRRSVSFTATHFSIFTVIGQFLGSIWDEFKSLFTQFIDGLDSGATGTVARPSCTGEDTARSDGYSVTFSTTDTVYWCFGMSGNNRILKVVDDRRYPLEIAHPNLSVSQGGSVDWAQLSSLSHLGSGQDTVLAPGDQVTYQVNVLSPGQGGIQTQMDGVGQSLYALQTGVDTLVEILTRFGAGSGSAGIDALSTFLRIPSCADSINRGPGALVSGCFSAKDMLDAFGTKGLLLAPIAAIGGLLSFFRSEWNALVDQFNGHDKYTVTINRAPPQTSISGDILSASGLGPIKFGMTPNEVQAVTGVNLDVHHISGPNCTVGTTPSLPNVEFNIAGGQIEDATVAAGSTIKTVDGISVGSTSAQLQGVYGSNLNVISEIYNGNGQGEVATGVGEYNVGPDNVTEESVAFVMDGDSVSSIVAGLAAVEVSFC